MFDGDLMLNDGCNLKSIGCYRRNRGNMVNITVRNRELLEKTLYELKDTFAITSTIFSCSFFYSI
jgi:hypothetical protein